MSLPAFFVSDLHGRVHRYGKLLERLEAERPRALFLGGDLLPMALDLAWAGEGQTDFLRDWLRPAFADLRERMGEAYPRVFLILGNDDPRAEEAAALEAEAEGLWTYAHGRRLELEDYTVIGYSHVPPTPFRLKDWERYDVSRYVDPGCVSPEQGSRSVSADPARIRYGTIAKDLAALAEGVDADRLLLLAHAPPYGGKLDRAGLDGQKVDHVPLDVHVGSIALQRFIEERQPRLTLHGHVHESARLTGAWMEMRGRTVSLGAAHDGPELALVRVDLEDPAAATRELL